MRANIRFAFKNVLLSIILLFFKMTQFFCLNLQEVTPVFFNKLETYVGNERAIEVKLQKLLQRTDKIKWKKNHQEDEQAFSKSKLY